MARMCCFLWALEDLNGTVCFLAPKNVPEINSPQGRNRSSLGLCDHVVSASAWTTLLRELLADLFGLYNHVQNIGARRASAGTFFSS